MSSKPTVRSPGRAHRRRSGPPAPEGPSSPAPGHPAAAPPAPIRMIPLVFRRGDRDGHAAERFTAGDIRA
ncbi:hypothetical protein GCM10010156_06620 [Planobispora rosea]|uniref:Uncharacterized protein n=1 Tax=Planobispora rosea TaxID=35762 RepID=A0A8J3WB38_PLARO|nr:hypothetical protein GCM10010156_06620 [Planobispora rosea]GIH82533.1 hypothetical protein Pro02_09410 [Planobispora rosea]